MPIPTNYSSLQSEVLNWLKRDDLVNDVATFIAFGEARINKISRLSNQEVQAPIITTAGQFYTDLPIGFLEHISLVYNNDLYEVPEKVDIEVLDRYKIQIGTSVPSHFAVSNGKYWWNSIPTENYQLTARYWKKWDIANDDTNFILENYPDVYLYTALAHGARMIRHPQQSNFEIYAQNALDDLEYYSIKQKKAPLRVDAGLQYKTRRNYFNINQGW